MVEDSFMLLSLKESQSKKLAQVISNETARKILDYLTEVEFTTETQISEKLKIPLSTVHYNMKALIESKLVIADEYHYSEKGKEVPHYKLAKKFIIIAPKDETSVMDKLKKFWPITAIAIGVGAIITFAQAIFSSGSSMMAKSADFAAAPAARMLTENAIMDAAPQAAGMLAEESAKVAANETIQAIPIIIQQDPSPFLTGGWFVAGALFVIILLLVWNLWKKK